MPSSKNLHISLMILAVAMTLTVIATPLVQAQFATIYQFTGGKDGGAPNGSVTVATSNILVGTTLFGGDLNCNPPLGCGTAWELDQATNTETAVPFEGGLDGAYPYDALERPIRRSVTGTTSAGGGASGCFGSGCGTIFRVTANGQKTVLYRFTGGTDGGMPFGGVIADRSGNFYGTTTFGGDLNCSAGLLGCGTIFVFLPNGHLMTLDSFHGGTDGANPLYGNLATDGQRHLYGTTQKGGGTTCNPPFGCGSAWDYDGLGRTRSSLHDFEGPDGEFPESGVTLSGNKLYGTAALGGDFGKGVLFQIDLTTKTFVVLHSFGSGVDGATPIGGVTLDPSGNVWGTTESGGLFGSGTLYKVDTQGQETVQHDFELVGDGGSPVAAPIYDPSCGCLTGECGCLSGTTSTSSEGEGTLWQFKP